VGRRVQIGIAGTGFVGRGLAIALESQKDFTLSAVLTRREIASIDNFPRKEKLTNSFQELVERSDVIVECTGDAIHATNVVEHAFNAARPVVTMNAEFQVTAGSYYADRGVLTEAEGDQPGCIAALAEQAREMGFTPVVYGNRKGFYQPDPAHEQMQFWAWKHGISITQVTSFTDGTKIQIEAALVANGLGAIIAQDGLIGVEADDLETGGIALARHAERLGFPISDYVLAPKAPAGVFLVVTGDPRQAAALNYLKLGRGPFYVLVQNYHLCHMEIPKTIRRILRGEPPLLTNSHTPTVGIAAIAKRRLVPGETIERGIGSFDLRGVAVSIADNPNHVPIGLISQARVVRPIEQGQLVINGDLDLPDTLALRAWQKISVRALETKIPVLGH
jgi:predicted homoserine dehydrogenase-like protein